MTQGPPNSQSASLFQLPFFHFPLLPCLSSPFPFPSSHFYFPSPPLKISQRSWVTASRSCILMHLFAAFISVFAPQSKHQRRSQWQVNSYAIIRVRNCAPPLKFAALFGQPRTRPRPALNRRFTYTYFNNAYFLNTTIIFQSTCYYTPDHINTGMGDCLRASTSSRYVTSHLGQLSLPSLRGILNRVPAFAGRD